tara:strand:+ start:373 stop:519 length:147 start_codon:yes stop_codon:yes gene_type:complete
MEATIVNAEIKAMNEMKAKNSLFLPSDMELNQRSDKAQDLTIDGMPGN